MLLLLKSFLLKKLIAEFRSGTTTRYTVMRKYVTLSRCHPRLVAILLGQGTSFVIMILIVWCISLATFSPRLLASPIDDHGDFFESRIRPLLVAHCYDCHADAAKSGLRVDSREALLEGGNRGPAIVLGKPEESLLIQSVSHTHETLRMPKGGAKLKDAEIADLARWISDGAIWPAKAPTIAKNDEVIKPEHKSFWSFQPVTHPAFPSVKGVTVNPIDAFLLAELEARGLGFSPPADKRTLIRRATYDLTGLPPTPGEIAAFLADHSPEAFAKVIDRLLANPHYGERWARHWLDLARYSDTLGLVDAGRNLQGWFPYAYTYRDWVIRALNLDLPYDQFLRQQIAADRLPNNDPRNLAALGFLSLSRGGLGVNIHERIDDKIDVVSRGLLGLTVSCARCHNHKFDPIPTKDYYSLYTIFSNSREPQKLPLLDPHSASGDKWPRDKWPRDRWEEELKAEEEKIESEIRKMREKRYPEIKALYRTETEIAKCLRSVYEARELKTDGELQKFAQEKDYNLYMLKRWRDYLKKAGEDSVWTIWHRLAALPEKDLKEKAAATLAAIDPGEKNQLVAESFKQPPASMREVADLYGKLLAAYDKPEPHNNADAEKLRQVLHTPDAPVNAPFSDYDQIRLSTDKQNEDGKRRRLENLFLAQAYRGAPGHAQSLEDVSDPKPGNVFLRGKPENRGEKVEPQFLLILAGENRKPFTRGSGRLELAEAIADQNNPLTPRVMANRIWLHHFGAGLVRTPSDFGARGDAPTHPALLDFLARSFIGNGWSIKKMHRLVMLSRAYQQSSADNPAARRLDPENKLLWRMNRRRLEMEEVRDSLLALSGKLDRTMGGLPLSAQAWPFTHRRTIYSFIDRALVPNDFRVFDFASPDAHSPERHLTTVPQQALMMMNSPFVLEQAKALIDRSEILAQQNPRRRITSLYRLIYGRSPKPEELRLGLRFISDPQNITKQSNQSGATDNSKCGAWQYGEGEYDEKADRVKSFTTLDYFINGQWRNSPFPGDPRESTAALTRKGGALGENRSHSAIRRWVAPFDGKIAIKGLLEHNFENACHNCKGVFARVVSNRTGSIGDWKVLFGKIETPVALFEVKRGDTIDFLVEAGKGTAGGEFKWSATIQRLDDGAETWDSVKDFRQPSVGALNAWSRYAQVLLAGAEFVMID